MARGFPRRPLPRQSAREAWTPGPETRQRGRQRLGGAAVALSKVQSVDQRMRLESVSAFANTGHAVTFVRRYLTGMTIGWPFSAMRKSIACARSVVLGFLMR